MITGFTFHPGYIFLTGNGSMKAFRLKRCQGYVALCLCGGVVDDCPLFLDIKSLGPLGITKVRFSILRNIYCPHGTYWHQHRGWYVFQYVTVWRDRSIVLYYWQCFFSEHHSEGSTVVRELIELFAPFPTDKMRTAKCAHGVFLVLNPNVSSVI